MLAPDVLADATVRQQAASEMLAENCACSTWR
jgi:hypothetical protein